MKCINCFKEMEITDQEGIKAVINHNSNSQQLYGFCNYCKTVVKLVGNIRNQIDVTNDDGPKGVA